MTVQAKDEITFEREDIADFVRTKHRLLERRKTRRAIYAELSETLAAFDAQVLKNQLTKAPDAEALGG